MENAEIFWSIQQSFYLLQQFNLLKSETSKISYVLNFFFANIKEDLVKKIPSH